MRIAVRAGTPTAIGWRADAHRVTSDSISRQPLLVIYVSTIDRKERLNTVSKARLKTHCCQGELPGIPPEIRKRRGSNRDVFHAYMTKGVIIDQISGMPVMWPEVQVPNGMISFSEAVGQKCPDYSCHVHFYENDDAIERFWNNPWHYLDKLGRFAGVVATDYSTGPSMPDPVRRYNVYRNQLTGAWMQSLGMPVLCNVRCPAFGRDYFLAGVPRRSLICIGEVGCVKNRYDRNRFEGGLVRAVQELEPTGIVVVGEDSYGVFDYARDCDVPLYFFKGKAARGHARGAHV